MAGKISISVTDEHAALLQEAVGSGDYASTSEVIREALREWRTRRALGQLWDEGVKSGPCEPGTTMADIRREARSRRTVV
ncbi:MAG: type II toxin-antitoxin system ParD family antitoxin [Rhodobacter sp.]|jgi:antitoxin ParD1/3/4|nr:type II toxin-antitoxin system ParD family antitoxin [Rhodobacter sp.]